MEPDGKGQLTQGPTALEQVRTLATALSEAARRARFSTRSRRVFTGGGFQARRGAKLMRVAVIASFIIFVVAPTLTGVVYFGFFASDQYVAKASFTVSGGEPPQMDNIGLLTGIPAIEIIQDTQIVTNFIHSRMAVEMLEKKVDLRHLYSRPKIDGWSRYDPDKPIEKLVKYWKHMTDISIKMPAGIVELEVRAFTPKDAALIGNAVLEISETLINNLNNRMHRDAVSSSEQQLERASARLTRARVSLENARNEGGLLDANKAADAMNALITETRGSLLRLQQEYVSMRQSVRESAPQMRALKSRIDATTEQIATLETNLTGTRKVPSSDPTLAVKMTKFAELDLEQNIAERIYAAATASLEMARLIAERKAMYINAFVKPAVPADPQYPRRTLSCVLIFGLAIVAWGTGLGLAVLIRNNMA